MLEFSKVQTDEDLRAAYEFYNFLKASKKEIYPLLKEKNTPKFHVMDDRVDYLPYE